MQPGRFNRRVKIQRLASTQDGLGQVTNTWVDVATVWADIRFGKGIEQIEADSPTSFAKVSVRIRYREGITAGMRVVHNLVNHNILAVLPDAARRQYVDLACEVIS